LVNEIKGIAEVVDVSLELQGLYRTISQMQKENAALRAECGHLKELLTATAPLISKDVHIEVPKEQAACEMQLVLLYEKSQQRELTLEETKRLEILIKSLYLIKDKATGITISSNTELSVESLTTLASHGE
jgi:hypothetical protein